MKNLITLLIVLTSILGYTQEFQWLNIDSVKSRNYKWYLENKESVELEFVRLIDSARQTNVGLVEYSETHGVKGDPDFDIGFTVSGNIYNTNKDLKEKYKQEKLNDSVVDIRIDKKSEFMSLVVSKTRKVNHIVYDSLLSLSAEHHAKYLINVQESGVATHQEFELHHGVKYSGDLPIIFEPSERVEFYSPNRYYKGECCRWDPTNDMNVTNGKFLYQKSASDVAYEYFDSFKNSPLHWKAYMQTGDVNLIGSYFGFDEVTNFISFVTVMGNKKKTKES